MSLKTLLSVNVPLRQRHRNLFSKGWFKKTQTKEEEKEKVADEIAVYQMFKEDTTEIEIKRNKSRLQPGHRNILMKKKPYNESIMWFHDTVKYKKRMLGRYGINALDVPAGVLWPTPEEVEDAKEYERVAFPLSLQERWQKLKTEKEEREEKKRARQAEVVEKMAKMNEFITEVQKKLAKKEAEMAAAKARKQKLIDDVRRHFGFAISPHDEKFKELLAQKEKEDMKKLKEAKKAAKAEKQMQRLLGLSKATTPKQGEQILPDKNQAAETEKK